jgi:hypothetical protein
VGLVLEPGRAADVRAKLVALAGDPAALHAMRDVALATYRRHFAKQLINDRWAGAARAPAQTVSVTK